MASIAPVRTPMNRPAASADSTPARALPDATARRFRMDTMVTSARTDAPLNRYPSRRHVVPIRFLNTVFFDNGLPERCAAPAAIDIFDMEQMETRTYRVNRGDICFIKYLLESYEGLATVTTLDPAAGSIVVRIAPGCAETVDAIMASLTGEMYFESIQAVTSTPADPSVGVS